MKNNKKLLFIALSLILILAMVSACSAKTSENEIDLTQENLVEENNDFGGLSPDEAVSEDSAPKAKPSPLEPTKLVVRFYLDMQTIEFDKSISALNKLISKNEAYVENSNIHLGDYYNQSSYRSAEYIIRVPKNNIDKFMDETGTIGKINTQEETKEDVTMHYRDTESRLNLLNVKEERILDLLKKADKMEDIISLENTLSDIIYEKENLTGVLQNLDNKVDYTTVTIYLSEVQNINLKDSGQISFGERISNAMSNSLYSFKIGFENFIIQLIYLLPLIVVLGVLGFLVSTGIRFYNKKKKASKKIDKDND